MWSTSEHLVQLSFMAMIIWGAQAFARRAHSGRVSREARRLRSALHIGLSALRKLYQDNLADLSGGERPLISGRNQINLLRTQLGRLTSLDPPEVEAVMAAMHCGRRERRRKWQSPAEKSEVLHSGFPRKNDAAKEIIESTLREVCSTLRTAEELLNLECDAARAERPPAETSPNREADAEDVREHAGASGVSRTVQDNPPFREKVKVPRAFLLTR